MQIEVTTINDAKEAARILEAKVSEMLLEYNAKYGLRVTGVGMVSRETKCYYNPVYRYTLNIIVPE